ncbi:hypothetical protein ACFL2Z_00015 [Candidatus Eisenbacteria bacterium]|uniref:Co-chaperone DjlA N-terminal domain-containing protein n=1 Tax=Eiseniibacteriota bacterium TaxID=2212470 RepID=A0ABV6YMH9_UNCEI
MGLLDFIEEAAELAVSLKWIENLEESMAASARTLLLPDFFRVAVLVADADGSFKVEKSDAILALSAVAMHGSGALGWFAAGDAQTPDAIERRESDLADMHVVLNKMRPDASVERLGAPVFLSMMASLSETPILEDTINALYRFAEVVAKSDGPITTSEETVLRQIWEKLHQEPSEE